MGLALSSLPESERPRERLLEQGVEGLSIQELIAIILGTGTKGKSVVALAEELLIHFKSLDTLLEASIPELREIKGIGLAKAIQLKAIFGLVQKCRKATLADKTRLKTTQDAFEIAQEEIGHHQQEVFLVLLRDIKGALIHREIVSIGTLSEVLVHPREIFYPAVRHKAHSLILAHNHPSGDPTPSKADLHLTRLLLQSAQVMGIAIDDHLIIGRHGYVSLKEKGYLV
jgi:DNA repair protein RadC